ncbi:hypothetical protein M8J75_007339 [Diaphorina citri]|nr:hypothetical protein M8J75_007339 [Diaphorina citri]KAI5743334.1 hypothetical protein M8J77_016969 [Diaphorina citri]
MSREQEIIRNILDELLDGNDSDFSDLDDSEDKDELTLAASTSENRIPEPQQQSAHSDVPQNLMRRQSIKLLKKF